MLLFDVNVLVQAHREDAPNHAAIKGWLEDVINGDTVYGLSDLVLGGFLRVVTHPRVFAQPTPIQQALEFTKGIRDRANCVFVSPGPRHWEIFSSLCARLDLKGNLVPDAFFAAMAIETGCTWVTMDRDYARFAPLSWRHPLEETPPVRG
jgi:toxin-antitoxin system PIN domain toxin